MKQLSGADSMFLQFEQRNNFMHVASLAIYDPSTAPGGGVRFKDILKFFTSRLEQFPQFRRRLVKVPLVTPQPPRQRSRLPTKPRTCSCLRTAPPSPSPTTW